MEYSVLGCVGVTVAVTNIVAASLVPRWGRFTGKEAKKLYVHRTSYSIVSVVCYLCCRCTATQLLRLEELNPVSAEGTV